MEKQNSFIRHGVWIKTNILQKKNVIFSVNDCEHSLPCAPKLPLPAGQGVRGAGFSGRVGGGQTGGGRCRGERVGSWVRGLRDQVGESAGLSKPVINTPGLLCTTSTPHCPHLQLAC